MGHEYSMSQIMLDLLDDTNFTHVPNHAGTVLRGSGPRPGSHTFQLEDSQPDACFAMCSAAEDCSGHDGAPMDYALSAAGLGV